MVNTKGMNPQQARMAGFQEAAGTTRDPEEHQRQSQKMIDELTRQRSRK